MRCLEVNAKNIQEVLEGIEIRSNIIKWYPFQEEAEILEIGTENRVITDYLNTIAKEVTIIAPPMETMKVIDKKFDYIIVIGQIEKAIQWFPDSSNPELELLTFISSLLKEDGKILIATDNKFGMQYWNGRKDLEGTLNYENLVQERTKNGCKLFSENTLKKLLEEADYQHYKFYYALPDYKMTNLIYASDYPITKEDISRNFQYYEPDEIINFKENEVYGQLWEENQEIFDFFINSFFIEIQKQPFENKIKYVTFSNYRKEEYRVMTIIKEKEVIKKAMNQKAEQHMNHIIETNALFHKENAKIIEREINGELVSDYIEAKRLDIVLEKSEDELFMQYFEKYANLLYQDTLPFDEVKEKPEWKEIFEAYNESKMKSMKFMENAYLDLIPKNCFLVDHEFLFFDQEWVEKYLPVEYVIYRAIQNSNLTDAKKKSIKEKYRLDEYRELLENLEEKFREKVIDKVMLHEIFNGKTRDREEIVATMTHYRNLKSMAEQEVLELKQKNERKQQEIQKAQEEIKRNQEEMQRMQTELEGIYDSRSWKAIEALRKIKNRGAKGE